MAVFASSSIASPAIALEGAETSSHKDWKNAKPHKLPSAEERAKELDARQQDIAAEIERLKQRLNRVPSPDKMEELNTKLQKIHKNFGWEPSSEMVYGRRSIDPMLKNQHTMPKNLLSAFVQLDKDLKARDIDLIILPLVPTPHFHAHTLVDGINADHEYFPGWTQMMIEMAEADLEVIDTVDEFRKEAENPVLVSWANDFHTGSTGRQIAARKLAERLQRYDFARELNGNQKLWTAAVQEKTGTMYPQRITTVNGMFTEIRKEELQEGHKHWKVKHPGRVAVLAKDAPNIEGALAKRQFKYLVLNDGGEAKNMLRTELVSIGDSQLHSAVYGSGLPAFINAEVGARFRWGSKSWSGFSPPEIYREVVPDKAIQPRVVVLTFLPKYFWHSYHLRGDQKGRINEEANKYKPRPLPPLKNAKAGPADAGDDALTKPFKATIKVTGVSKQRDPKTLTYDEALTHTAAVVTKGPKELVGQEIGVRHWTMVNRVLIRKAGDLKPGTTLDVTLHDWMEVIEKDPTLAQHQIFNDTEQDLLIPVFWIADGPLSAKALKITLKKQ